LVIGLGVIRFVLAMMVLMNHVWLPTANVIGAHAVTGFYIVSGFLMTKVINEVYVGDGGRLRYLANRALRIYPLYLLVLLTSLAFVAIWPNYFQVYSLIRIPMDGSEWFSNVSLWQLTDSPTIVIPPAWSLYVEVFFYLLIAFIARARGMVVLWFLASLLYTLWMIANGYSFADRYYPLGAASLFFSTGAIIYFLAKEGRYYFFDFFSEPIICGLLALFVIFPFVIGDLGGGRHWLGYYGASALFAILFTVLVVKARLSGGKVDKFMGDLAYPIFLTHFLAVGLVNLITDNRFAVTGHANFILATLACLSMSVAYLKWIEPLIDGIRNQVRERTA
jgi:peptidoglycan/LPS O-acetylase OafA/YrhL